MRTLTVVATLFFLAGAAKADEDAASHLVDVLRQENAISFYFVARTGKYALDSNHLRQEATTVIYRKCGANCHNFMKNVVEHLMEATPIQCQKGQENLLVETSSGVVITYSHGGRSIEFDGHCYFNSQGVDSLIKATDFLFS